MPFTSHVKSAMRFRYILFLAICCSACKQQQPTVTIFKSNDLVIADSSFKATQFLPIEDYSTDYPIYYIGPVTDTIRIGRRYWLGRTDWKGRHFIPWSWTYSNRNLRIFIDTTAKTDSPVEYLSENGKVIQDSTVHYHSFLFSIRNISDSNVYMGLTFSLFYINREAKDRKGNWVPIDQKLSREAICTTNEPQVFLQPGELIISKMRRYHGSFVTDFRLAFGYDKNIVYSNIFRDSIDERILQHHTQQ